jgi:hypothetical protein
VARTNSKKIDRWIKRHTDEHLCMCGCGNVIEIKRKHYKKGIPKFCKGHNFRTFNPRQGKEAPNRLTLWESLSEEERARRLSMLKNFPRGKTHPNWGGGEIITESGYLHIRVYDHPKCSSGYIPEHRRIVECWVRENYPTHKFMEEINGEVYLNDDVIVHHRNEDKLCNDLGNLVLMRDQGIHLSWHMQKISEEEKFIKYENKIFCPWIDKEILDGTN